MTVYRKKSSPYWHFDFQFKGVRYHGSTGCTSKRAAEQYEARERQLAALPRKNKLPLTMDEAGGLYADYVCDKPSWPTERYMIAALVETFGRQLISEISQRELQVYFAKRRDGRSNASINREIDTARAIWNRAKKARFDIGEMPDWSAFRLKVPERPPPELTAEQQDAIFDAIPADAYDVVMFALISSWRKAEVITLRWSDLNLARGEAHRRIKGGDIVVRHLNQSMTAIIANQPKVGPYVFTYVCRKSRQKRRAGHRYPMTVTALRTRWREAREAAQLLGFRFHDLRHTAATRILRETGNLAVTQKVLGHKNIKTTLRYAHVLDEDIRKGLDAGEFAVKSRNSPEHSKRGQGKQ